MSQQDLESRVVALETQYLNVKDEMSDNNAHVKTPVQFSLGAFVVFCIFLGAALLIGIALGAVLPRSTKDRPAASVAPYVRIDELT